MIICNVKINKKICLKLFALLFIIIAIVFSIVGKRFISSMSKFKVSDEIKTDFLEITNNNYTNILKDSHENIDKYVGKKVKFVGFVYRLYDFNENEFVLAREMIISSDNHAVVVGFLCNCETASNFKDGCWVEAEGTIQKGYYHGDLPVIKIDSLRQVATPKDEYVFPPSDSYVPEAL